uniref:Uncharacterized protein n=1 Tax=Trypanosoma vivax (strain Y486) TaxID=1055687 RepID=G0U3F9_TRYVY|nr:conserved hypothetical protein [Trypanosoma vivax Y486]
MALNERENRDNHMQGTTTGDSNNDVVSGAPQLPNFDEHIKGVVTRSLEEILKQRPLQPVRLLANRLLESSKNHEIQQIECVVGDGTNCQMTKACTRKSGSESLKLQSLPLLRLLTPNTFEVEAALRHLSSTSMPDSRVILFVEQPTPPTDLFFLKGVPYFANVTEQLLARRRNGTPDKELDNYVGGHAMVTKLRDALDLDIKSLQQEMHELSSTIGCTVVELPQPQSNFFGVFHAINNALDPRDFGTTSTLTEAASKDSVPCVLLVSYSPKTICMTFSRIVASMLPLYERAQRRKIAETITKNRALVKQLNFEYVTEYWKSVLQRRDARDKARGEQPVNLVRTTTKKHHAQNAPPTPRALKNAAKRDNMRMRAQRRENEDATFLRVVQQLQSYAVTRIQALYRGYRMRKYSKTMATLRLKLQERKATSKAACWVEELPSSLPPLLRRCLERLSDVHGEVFGNYAISCPPFPRSVTMLKPKRKVIRSGAADGSVCDWDVDSESEEWEEEQVVIPMQRQTKPPPHFNLLRRLMECEFLSDCNTMKYALTIQHDCTGMTLLQRRAYDCYKSLILNLLHIAYLELRHRSLMPVTVRNLEGYVQRFHLDILGWLSAPHMFSRIALRQRTQSKRPTPILCSKEVMEKERVLVVRGYGKAGIYHAQECAQKTADAQRRKTSNTEGIEDDQSSSEVQMTLGFFGVYAVPALLPEKSWECVLKTIAHNDSKAKIAWWTLHDGPAAYVNGQPVALVPRHERQEVEGRPLYDELVPCIEVSEEENQSTHSTYDSIRNSSTTSTQGFPSSAPDTSDTTTNLSTKTQFHLALASANDSRTVDGIHGTVCQNTVDPVSTFGVTLLEEDFCLAQELIQDTRREPREMVRQYCVIGPLTQFSIPAPRYGMQPFIVAPPISEVTTGQMNEDINTDTFSSSGVQSVCLLGTQNSTHLPAESKQAHSQELYSGPLLTAEAAPAEHRVSLHDCSRRRLSGQVADSCSPVIETVDGIAKRVGRCVLKEGYLCHERPWLTPVCGRTRAEHFSAFILKCLRQMHKGYKIVMAVEDPHQLMLFNAVCLLKRCFDQNANPNNGLENSFSDYGVARRPRTPLPCLLSSETNECLHFMHAFYEGLAKVVDGSKVSIMNCVYTVQDIMKNASPGGLMFVEQIPMLMKHAERLTDHRSLRECITVIVQRVELYCWLILFEAFLTSISTTAAPTQLELELPRFPTFVNDYNLLTWLESIDPWLEVPERSPDPFHLRYSNGLRRWDDTCYIYRGANHP